MKNHFIINKPDVCTFICPNCGKQHSIVPSSNENIVKCDLKCGYSTRVFSKRHAKKAYDHYIVLSSIRVKYFSNAEDGRYLVTYAEKANPFIADNLFDLVNPKILQTIEEGLSTRLDKAFVIIAKFRDPKNTINRSEDIVKIIDLKSGKFGRIDLIKENIHNNQFCKRLRRNSCYDEMCNTWDAE
jgi:hypothetical protein